MYQKLNARGTYTHKIWNSKEDYSVGSHNMGPWPGLLLLKKDNGLGSKPITRNIKVGVVCES